MGVQRGSYRADILYESCPNWWACLWEKPAGWSHVTNEDKLFCNIVETWTWAAVLLGKLQQVAHVAWWCTICAESANAPAAAGSVRAHPTFQALLHGAAGAVARSLAGGDPRGGVSLVDNTG
eukprot:6486473-Amphidinium_carterae.1